MQLNDEVISLGDLIQVASASRRTLRIRVQAGKAAGAIHIEDGRLVYADLGDLAGADALYASLGAPGVAYAVDAGIAAPAHNLAGSTTHLLLEAARRHDEGSLPWPRAAAAVRLSSVEEAAAPVRARRAVVWAAAASVTLVLAAIVGWQLGGSRRANRRPPLTAAAPAAATAAEADPAASAASRAAAAAGAVEADSLTAAGDVRPSLLDGPPPRRPDVDLALTPTIICRLLIAADGRVADARVYRSRLELAAFEEAALDAAGRYRFSPARRAGTPVAVWINWPVSFATAIPSAQRIRIKGSDTIGGALGPALARAYAAAHPSAEVAVEALGSSTAFVGLFDGSADIGASSRPVNDAEIAEATRLGVELEEIVIGYDGLAVLVHTDNPIQQLTLAQASQIFTGAVTNWRDLGGRDAPIKLIGRPGYSGTHAFFRDKVLRRGDKESKADFPASTETVETSEAVALRVSADPDAIGYAGIGWIQPGTRAVPLAAGSGQPPISPNEATVRDGTYPVYRPLLMYTLGRPRGAVAAFLRFILSADGQALVESNGFVPSGVPADAAIPASAEAEATPASAAAAPLARIEFGATSSALSAEAKKSLWRLAQQLRERGGRILVVGNADNDGGAEANRVTARERADAVARYLQANGIAAERIAVDSAGADRPLETNTTSGGRRHNRRVDIFATR